MISPAGPTSKPGTYNFPCTTCHSYPETHINSTVEVDFSKSTPPNPGGNWNNVKTCSGLYCHSNGRNSNSKGAEQWDTSNLDCNGCHQTNSLSGEHNEHVGDYDCQTCHSTAKGSDGIADFLKHVNGKKEYDGPIPFSNGRCNGNCHGERNHENDNWIGN